MPLIGVNVVEKGTTNGAITDIDGNYSLNVSVGSELEFSYIGFISQTVKITTGNTTYNIILNEDTETLDEVVVVGYGVQKKSVVTAAMSKVSADELNVGTPTSVSDVLKGKISGVAITAESGQPGTSSKIRIRGTGTVNESDPLYIIDGMPSNNGIDYLNPSDIESIEVLKDAASAAIYGARGANGVVLVTTKKGSFQQKTTVNYEFTYGIQNPSKKIDLMNTEQYVMMMNEMAENSGLDPYFTSVPNVNTDWQDALTYNNAPIINHKLSVSGGGEHSTHYASFGYIKQRGIFAKGHSDYERYNGRLNYSNTLFDIKSRNFLNVCFMAGLFINVNYIVVPIFLMLRDGDTWLRGIFGNGFLLNNIFVLAVVYAATALPFTIYLLSGYFATLPHDFEEAAYIDGAGYSTTMVKIIFPMAQPSIITIILFNFLSFWNEYIISLTLLSSANGPRTLPVGLLNLMQAQQSAAQYGIMYAGLVMVMLPTLILYICVQKKLIQGMTVGGLKG